LKKPDSDTFKRAGKPPIKLTPADKALQSDDLVEMTNAGLIPMTVAEDNVARFWAKIFPELGRKSARSHS
jgi:membrane-bound lytic murein transglycosylase MltF